MSLTIDRVRKSVKLSPLEFKAFKKYVNGKETKVDASIEIDITRPTLDRVLLSGSGSPETIEKIKAVINV